MSFLYAVSEIRTTWLTALMNAVTYLGDHSLLMAAGLIVIWCVDKEWGYRLFFIGLMGAAVNQLLKMAFEVPRPWILDPNFHIVEQARAAATGYSFPSGHTQGAVMLLGTLAVWIRKRWAFFAAAGGVLLVAFSRMYLGVHTLADVTASIFTGALILLFADRYFQNKLHEEKRLLWLGTAAFCVSLLAVLLGGALGADAAQGLKDAYVTLGGTLALFVIYFLDARVIQYPTHALWWTQAIKCVFGCILVVLLREILKSPLQQMFAEHPFADALRYFLIALVGGALWPLTFQYFSRLGAENSA